MYQHRIEGLGGSESCRLADAHTKVYAREVICASTLSRTFFEKVAKNASSSSINAKLSTVRFASNAAIGVIACFL